MANFNANQYYGTSKPLSADENKSLITNYQQTRNPEILDKLIRGNKGLVMSIVLKIGECKSLTQEDLFQIGMNALIEVIDKFNPQEGSAFPSYASKCIKGKILRKVNNIDRSVRLPVHLEEKIQVLLKASRFLETSLGRSPTNEELSEQTGLSLRQIEDIQVVLTQYSDTSIDATIGSDTEAAIGDFVFQEGLFYSPIGVDKDIDQIIFLAGLRKLLTPIQYYIVFYNVLSEDKITCEDLGLSLGINKQRVSKLKGDALKIIRTYATCEGVSLPNQRFDVDELNTAPILPQHVLGYLYIKDDLEEQERKLLHFLLFSEIKYSPKTAARQLSCTEAEIIELDRTLKAKIKAKFRDKRNFAIYAENMKTEHKSGIYKLIEPEEAPVPRCCVPRR